MRTSVLPPEVGVDALDVPLETPEGTLGVELDEEELPTVVATGMASGPARVDQRRYSRPVQNRPG
jgi:hypothetical protein